MIIFKNPGLIDTVAMVTSGVSAKERDNPIGIFGTGLKYAIAILLRNDCTIDIWRGNKRYAFTLVEKTIRKRKFNIVCMNGKFFGFTDRLGLNWEPWMAFRELYCNAKDEGGISMCIDPGQLADPMYGPSTKATTIVCTGRVIENAYMHRHETILMTAPLFSLKNVDVHQGESEYLFYRGIRVHKLPQKSMYTYNLTGAQFLTEDRTLLYPYVIGGTIARSIVGATQIQFLDDVLRDEHSTRDRFEKHLPYSSVVDEKPSPQFMEVCEGLRDRKQLVSTALKLFKDYQDTMPGYVSPYLVSLTAVEQAIVEDAISRVTAKVPSPGFAGIKIQFKSKTEQYKLTTTGGTITLDHALIRQGAPSLARWLLQGLAIKQGGSVAMQLSELALTGRFIDEDLVDTPSVSELDDIPF